MYSYQDLKPNLLKTVHGMRYLSRTCETVARLGDRFTMNDVWKIVMGDAWYVLASLDYLVEQEVLVEISPLDVFGQHRIFVKR